VPQRVEDLMSYLPGTWHLQRSILSGGTEVGRFTGTACFRADVVAPGLLHYREDGTLHLGAHAVPATRTLTYRVEGPRAHISFDDGRPFHDLDLRSGADEADHPCGDDRYHGRFVVLDGDTWRHEWDVTGPRKDHLIRTVLTRDRPVRPADPAPSTPRR
jgi:hypothetical protein